MSVQPNTAQARQTRIAPASTAGATPPKSVANACTGGAGDQAEYRDQFAASFPRTIGVGQSVVKSRSGSPAPCQANCTGRRRRRREAHQPEHHQGGHADRMTGSMLTCCREKAPLPRGRSPPRRSKARAGAIGRTATAWRSPAMPGRRNPFVGEDRAEPALQCHATSPCVPSPRSYRWKTRVVRIKPDNFTMQSRTRSRALTSDLRESSVGIGFPVASMNRQRRESKSTHQIK